MVRGITFFECPKCGLKFMAPGIEYHCSCASSPIPCPKCGAKSYTPGPTGEMMRKLIDMDTTLTGFLSRDYPQGHNLQWDSATMSVRCERAASVVFDLKDKMPTYVLLHPDPVATGTKEGKGCHIANSPKQ